MGRDRWKPIERELRLASGVGGGDVHIAGVDEVGRGPLAGPVVACAVVMPPDIRAIPGVDDSKQLTEIQREKYFDIITAHPDIRFGIATVDTETIDRINILQATHQAMNLALAQLLPAPEHVLPRYERGQGKRDATSLEESSLRHVRFRSPESGRDEAVTLRVLTGDDG